MHIIFVTRCYKPTNIQKQKENLKEVFANQTKHTYMQYLVVDMSYGQKEQAFKILEDDHTKTFFVYDKKDYYNNEGMDRLFKTLNDEQNVWVFTLDDDGLINTEILDVFNDYQDEDVIMINGSLKQFTIGNVVGICGSDQYITTLKVRKEVPIGPKPGELSYAADGTFFENILKANKYKIKYTTYHPSLFNVLPRPLNVLNATL